MSIHKVLAIVAGAATIVTVMGASAQPTYASGCVSGTTGAHFNGKWISRDTVTFTTVDNRPLCQDVTINVSSYTMPDGYDGKEFIVWDQANNRNIYNETASPQTVFATKKVALKAGTNGQSTVTIDMPSTCKNVQTDAYTGPEIKTVYKEGHGNAVFAWNISKKTGTCETPAPEPKMIDVCRLSDHKYPVSIKETDFDATKHSKNPSDCIPVQVKAIDVCRLSDKTYPVSIKETDFDSNKYSKNANDCKTVTPVKPTEAPKKETPAPAVTELPRTGASFVSVAMVLSAIAAAAIAYARPRRAQQ